MFAIIQEGGKQYKVSIGSIIDIEKIKGKIGDNIELKNILMVKDDTGKVLLKDDLNDAKIKARIINQFKGKKVIIFKKKRRETYKKKFGHRQHYTKIQIEEIEYKGGEK